jgi:hypothetical protein
MAKSLNETRRQTAEHLDEQVDQFDDEPDDLHTRVAEAKLLRGLPAVGPLSAGSAIAGTEPGTDEHLERLS